LVIHRQFAWKIFLPSSDIFSVPSGLIFLFDCISRWTEVWLKQQLEQPETHGTDHWLDDLFDEEFHAAVNSFDLSSELDLDKLFGVNGPQEQLASRKRPRRESPTPGNNGLLFETKRAKSNENTANPEDRDAVANTLEACISENPRSSNKEFDEPQSPTADTPPTEFQAEATAQDQDISEDIGIENEKPPVGNPETTNACFCLHGDNLTAGDLLKSPPQVREQEVYSSPYLCNNSVEYFPSSPSTHNNLKLRLDMMNLENIRRSISIEYANHRRTCEAWLTSDPLTGKTRGQLIEEENEQLKCQVSKLKQQAASLKREVTNKGNKYRSLKQEYDNLTGVYNNLVEIHNNYCKTQQSFLPQLVWLMPNASPGAAPYLAPVTPHGPPPVVGSMPTQKSTGSNHPAKPSRPASTASPHATPCPPAAISSPSHTTVGTVSIPIDLTADENQKEGENHNEGEDQKNRNEGRSRNELATSDPLPNADGGKLLQSLRKKSYKWLPVGNQLGNLRQPHRNSAFSGGDDNRPHQSNSASSTPKDGTPSIINVTDDAQVIAGISAEDTNEADIGSTADYEELLEDFERELANGA
jgi:hypothetical protein